MPVLYEWYELAENFQRDHPIHAYSTSLTPIFKSATWHTTRMFKLLECNVIQLTSKEKF